MGVDFRVLGPLDLRHAGARVAAGTPKQRTILVLLLMNANQPVSAARMVDELWPAGAPNSAHANVTTYVSRLRRVLASAGCALRRRESAYSLHTEPDSIDVNRFTGLAGRAEAAWRAGDVPGSAFFWEEALRIWRGHAFDGVPAGPELEAVGASLQEQRLAALESHALARLRLGDGAELVPALLAHTRAEPLRETGWLLLMAALRLGGNPAAALDAYEQARATLAERLGADPGRRLRELHRAILADEDPLSIMDIPSAAAAGRAAAPKPAQLPLDLPGFVGREAELRRLDDALPRALTQARIIVVAGMAGVGKTALAVHWAHRAAARFPDGQLYANLMGFAPSGQPIAPADVLKGFLDALGVPAERVPSDVDGRAALFRTLLARRRMLVLLDNAASAEQVRPLLPGAAGCLVLVTSRTHLSGLVAGAGAEPLTLGLLSPAEARRMFAERLGAERAAAEPQALSDIIERCARLPLALAIVAARAAVRPVAGLSLLAADLLDAGSGLDPFADDDAATDVRAVFASSYRALHPDQARLFRLLGLHPGAEAGVAAAASLAALPTALTARLLGELARGHLVTEASPGRYGMHDLLRAFAAEKAETTDAAAEREGALRRLFDHYVRACQAGALALNPFRPATEPGLLSPGVVELDLADAAAALAWFREEHSTLVACVALATAAGQPGYTVRLAGALTTFLDRGGHWTEWASTQRTAIEAARGVGDRIGQAQSHRRLARALTRMSRFEDAQTQAGHALSLFAGERDRAGEADTHLDVAMLLDHMGRRPEALERAQLALTMLRGTGDAAAKANALNSVGWYHALLGDYRHALEHCEEALKLLRGLGYRDSEAHTWDSLGYAHLHLGEYAQAIGCHGRALSLFRELGDRYYEARILTHLGEAHRAAGDAGAAETALREALAILDDLGHPAAAQVRSALRNQR